jgi:predicted alpha/beta-hydrolase family hydrolase
VTGLTVPTPHGPAHVELRCARQGRAVLLLGHGAGGSISAPDLTACARAATAVGVHVALITQPYRVAGRRGGVPPRRPGSWTRRGWRSAGVWGKGRSAACR